MSGFHSLPQNSHLCNGSSIAVTQGPNFSLEEWTWTPRRFVVTRCFIGRCVWLVFLYIFVCTGHGIFRPRLHGSCSRRCCSKNSGGSGMHGGTGDGGLLVLSSFANLFLSGFVQKVQKFYSFIVAFFLLFVVARDEYVFFFRRLLFVFLLFLFPLSLPRMNPLFSCSHHWVAARTFRRKDPSKWEIRVGMAIKSNKRVGYQRFLPVVCW